MLHPPGFTQFFGDIRQWGLTHQGTSNLTIVTPPLTFTQFLVGIATDAGSGMYSKGFGCDGKNFLIYTATYGAVDTRWIAITRQTVDTYEYRDNCITHCYAT